MLQRVNKPNVKVPDPTDKHVGARVRMRRMMLGLSQTALGDGLGLTFQQVQKYEKGTNRIGASRLQHIAQILQVPVSFFFDGAPCARVGVDGEAILGGKAPSPAYVSDFLASSDGLRLTRAFQRIGDGKLRAPHRRSCRADRAMREPAQICAPTPDPSRDILDRLGEALRRRRHGLMRPLWADMAEADKKGWRHLASTFVVDLKKVGIRLEVER